MNNFIHFVILLVFSETPLSSSTPELYRNCSNHFRCGDVVAGFPFWGGDQRPRECGHPGLKLHCDYNDTAAILEIIGVRYRVIKIDQETKRLKIARDDYESGICTQNIQDTTLDDTLFVSAPDYVNFTLLYACTSHIPINATADFNCSLKSIYGVNSTKGFIVPGDTGPMGCFASATVLVPEQRKGFEQALIDGFVVEWKVDDEGYCQKCMASKGECGINPLNETAVCYCQEPSSSLKECHPLPAAAPPAVAANEPGKPKVSSSKVENHTRVEAFIIQHGSLAPKKFSYSEIQKITNSFADKLGQGGYGSVYKGKLLDGRIVAVKVLSNSKGNGQEFINEVASISRTSHVNIVTLLGFCYERSKRALIYEFMSNGSLDKFINNQRSPEDHQLAIKTLHEIALGIARGLEYLHRGCTTRILHFDIKPQNILLDTNFCPKISDFGLAKLCETRDTIVSMTRARGTCGYIAPEVFCRSFGGVSYKSDVYSYGMMILDMVGGRRKNVNLEMSHSSEIYFPTWLYKQLEKSEKLNLDRVIAEEEEEMTRKMMIVSLWCIQTFPSDRPSMSRVLEMLQGSLEDLPNPPNPMNSATAVRPPQNSSTTSSSSLIHITG
ncbi:hypothetical protein SLEP1_g27367 [Rubroshorea leprosula]|uniref:non-specific serine/threonine protein kinase n=1 Tax=Rubroshorea leprosula TaxID=152421 RepID=A0AAV5JVQ5_9ROSI|nr:hypothetical protein SLEP1_g27367 [Rubroshorea leprosula]